MRSMSMRQSIARLAATAATAFVVGCGPGGVDESPDPPAEPEWAYGWWMALSTPNLHNEWGAYIVQMEIRQDGTVLQVVDYCNGPDWSYESRWELQPDGSIRVLPKAGSDELPFLTPDGGSFYYFDILPNGGACTLQFTLTSVGDPIPGGPLERGHWCIGEYLPQFDDCAPEKYCGEEPPVCE